MSRATIVLLCAVALGGAAVVARASVRVRAIGAELRAVTTAGDAAGASFVETLRGEHAERQQLAFDRRRALALELAAARRDRLLGALAVAGAALGGAAARALGRISAEIDEDRQHLRAQPGDARADRS
jgi:hypothetical protein